MKFGEYEVASAEGLILAHSKKTETGVIKKGTVLTAANIAALQASGHQTLQAAELEDGDVLEDEAAKALAQALCGMGLRAAPAKTGRANLHATEDGIAIIDHDRIHRINMLDERVTVATVRPYAAMVRRQLFATIKIITYAVPEFILERAIEIAERSGPALEVASFEPKRSALLMTELDPSDRKLLEKGRKSTEERLARFGEPVDILPVTNHDAASIAEALSAASDRGYDLIFVLSASAIVDRGDIVPSGLVQAGGRIDQFGLPVDPGNLLLLGTLNGCRVVGIPGCARSPSLNGFDWVLERLHAGLKVATRDVSRMGVGGLLKEIPSRPQPRDISDTKEAGPASETYRIHALVLAAGQSRRMGPKNKLLLDLDNKPIIAHAVDTVLSSKASGVTVVTGFEQEKVERALEGRPLQFTHNPAFASGLSSSLRAGIEALPGDVDGVLICLGDMPLVNSDEIDTIIEAFASAGPGTICIPTVHGKSGNPALLPRALFHEVLTLEGDVGAKSIIEQHREDVVRVELASGSTLQDIDTEAMLGDVRDKIGKES